MFAEQGTVPSEIVRITQHDLDFTVDEITGLGDLSVIVMAGKKRLLKMTYTGQDYVQVFDMTLPGEMAIDCYKGMGASDDNAAGYRRHGHCVF